jgi:integrase/recombinase XerD
MGVKRKIVRNSGPTVYMLDDVFEDFIIEKEAGNRSAATIFNYRKSYMKFKELLGEEIETCDTIDASCIYKFIHYMKQDAIKVASINHYIRDIRAFLFWCMNLNREYIKPFEISEQKQQEELPKHYTIDELEKLLEKPRKKDSFADWRMWAIICLVFDIGCRSESVCNIKMKDVNFAKQEITITYTKNNQIQILPMSNDLITVLKSYINECRPQAQSVSYLFPNIAEDKLTGNALRHAMQKYCHDKGVDKTSIHSVRHSFALEFAKSSGGDIMRLQKLLGHSTLAMTRNYVKLSDEDIKRNYDAYSPLSKVKKASRRTQAVQRASKK